MLYSQWRPSEGGYDVFEAPGDVPLGNDLGTPSLQPIKGIGVPSVEAGRGLPSGAKYVGTSDLPEGLITPVDDTKLGALSLAAVSPWAAFAAGAFVVSAIWFFWGRKR